MIIVENLFKKLNVFASANTFWKIPQMMKWQNCKIQETYSYPFMPCKVSSQPSLQSCSNFGWEFEALFSHMYKNVVSLINSLFWILPNTWQDINQSSKKLSTELKKQQSFYLSCPLRLRTIHLVVVEIHLWFELLPLRIAVGFSRTITTGSLSTSVCWNRARG